MLFSLTGNDRLKVSKLIKQLNHELHIEAVLTGNSPGEVHVDDVDNPSSVLVVTPDCTVVAGKSDDESFNRAIGEKLEFFDQVTCDNEQWENRISDIHQNIALTKYTRRYYQLEQLRYESFIDHLPGGYYLEYVNVDNVDTIPYENSEEIKEWFQFTDLHKYKDYCLGAYIRNETTAVSWCLVDCIVDDKIEIGVKTDKSYRRQGLGVIASAAAVNASLANGIRQIGWHCVDSNVGSAAIAEKVGFVKVTDYCSFTPYPPIENVTDLTQAEWIEWALHFVEKNKIKPHFDWMAAKCWAKAGEIRQAMLHIENLSRAGETWVLDYYADADEFAAFEEQEAWKKFREHLWNTYEVQLG